MNKKRTGYPEVIMRLPEADIQIKGVKAYILQGEQHQLAFFEMEPSALVPEHQHDYDQWGMIIEGKMELTIDNETKTCKTGDEYVIPAQAKHRAKFLIKSRVMDFFSEKDRYKIKPTSRMSERFDFKKFEERIDKEGLVWEEKEQFEKAIEAYDKLLAEIEAASPTNQSEKNGKNAIEAYLLMRKAGVFLQTGKTEIGEQLMHQASKHAKQSSNSLIIARAELGLGVFYGSTNRLEKGEKRLKAALRSFSKGTDYDSKQGYGWALLNLGGLRRKQGKLHQAEQNLLEAINTLEIIKNWVGVASAYELKAKVNEAKGNVELAREDLMKAISFYEKQGMNEKADSLRKNTKMRDAL
ncbi:MAG TPA: cupin domain-containing protein [Candidatus Acidoferrum sp.]|nr:cupin domain-containing protein [Candidatus Acidoferrum sp.]